MPKTIFMRFQILNDVFDAVIFFNDGKVVLKQMKINSGPKCSSILKRLNAERLQRVEKKSLTAIKQLVRRR